MSATVTYEGSNVLIVWGDQSSKVGGDTHTAMHLNQSCRMDVKSDHLKITMASGENIMMTTGVHATYPQVDFDGASTDEELFEKFLEQY